MVLATRTMLFTDIEGSTPLIARAGDRFRGLLELHRRHVRDELALHNGIEHTTEGDSFFATFDTPSSALAAAVAMQHRLEGEAWPEGLRVRVRMGLHVGEVSTEDDLPVGLSIHHAARIGAAAHGGQIILSDAVRNLGPALPDGVTLRSLGVHRLRDIGEIELLQVVHPDLQAEFAPPRGAVQDRVNLPQPRTEFVGGDALLAGIDAQLAQGTLLTLTGTGGVGKTRAAIEYGWRHRDRFEHGVQFIDLAPLSGGGAVVSAIAGVLPIVSGTGGSPLDVVIDWLGDRQLLLVFDNCEHLLDEAAEVLDALVHRCPNLKIVATSREAVGVPGERVLRVPSMAPGGDALELFRRRAEAADAAFTMDGQHDTVVQICTRLDGIPLAIELAAARVRSLSPAELLERLEDRFRLLRGSGRGTLDRHNTLRAMVSWSYQLLTAEEQCLFDRLSVFAGGFDLRAAEAVCGFDPVDELDVVELLSSLVDKSMVMAGREVTATRYRLLETMRQFGEERLEAAPEAVDVRRRHLRHYAALAADLRTLVVGRRQVEGTVLMALEWDNFRTAHLWALAERDLANAEAIVLSTFEFAEVRMRHEHLTMAERTEELAEELGTPSTALLGIASQWTGMLGFEDQSVDLAHRGLAAADDPDEPSTWLCWFNLLGNSTALDPADPFVQQTVRQMHRVAANLEDLDHNWVPLVDLLDTVSWADPDAAPAVMRRVRELADRVRAPRLMVFALNYEAIALLEGDDPAGHVAVVDIYEQSLALARDADDVQQVALALRLLATATTRIQAADAIERCHDAVAYLFDHRYWQKLRQAFDSAALALAQTGRLDEAATVLGHLDAQVPPFGLEDQLGFRERTRALVGARPAQADAGARMSTDDVAQAILEWTAE